MVALSGDSPTLTGAVLTLTGAGNSILIQSKCEYKYEIQSVNSQHHPLDDGDKVTLVLLMIMIM